MATTIHDVARSASVSVTTVSRALAQPDLLRPDTRERVLAAAKALDYHPKTALILRATTAPPPTWSGAAAD